jgi:hypothetical protein
MNYTDFIESKTHFGDNMGIKPIHLSDKLFDFQRHLVEWSLIKGRSAIFADCGLGKTFIELVWSDNIVRHTNKPVLNLTPLAVAGQTVNEAEKFGIEAERSRDGKFSSGAKTIVTNYDRLHYFDPNDFSGIVCDESSILKNFDGATKAAVTEFARKMPYRLLGTATAAPNDYIELGTSSEALGVMGYIDMLKMFFKAEGNVYAQGGNGGGGARRFAKGNFGGKFRFRGHSQKDFWRWVCSWARAVQKPSDLGFDDGNFKLPKLITNQHVVSARQTNPDFLFDMPAVGLQEQRAERRRSLSERCEVAANIINNKTGPSIAWCHLNDEGDLLTSLIPDAVQVSGSDTDERKEEVFESFSSGKIRVLVSKPVIAGLGLNWQHCNHQTFFPSHSFEQWYQAVRRCWRYGQKRDVTVDVISSEGEADVLKNLQRKSDAAAQMFSQLVDLMNDELKVNKTRHETKQPVIPSWLS